MWEDSISVLQLNHSSSWLKCQRQPFNSSMSKVAGVAFYDFLPHVTWKKGCAAQYNFAHFKATWKGIIRSSTNVQWQKRFREPEFNIYLLIWVDISAY